MNEIIKAAEKIIEAHKDGYYGCSAREERYSKLIAAMAEELKKREE